MHPGVDFWTVFSLIFLVTAIPVAIMIILEKRSPFKTAAWVLALILLPVFGVVFYLFFGQEYRKKKLFSRKGLKSLNVYRKLSFRQIRQFEHSLDKLNPTARGKENIIRLLLKNSNALLTTGNELQILNNGEETFTAIFGAIKAARHHVHLEYYILDNDKIGNQLKDLLIEKRREGVEVRMIVDDVGSWGLGKKYMTELREKGVEIYSFMEVRFPRLTSQVNYRNHRKIVVVDGKIGFTGGLNIADRYLRGLKRIGPWHDTHLQITGDAVNCLQVVFAADWFFVVNENLNGENYFPPLKEYPGTPVQISASGPDSDWDSIGQAFFAALGSAKSKIYIVTPYLMPPLEIIYALKTAALSNVDVRILMPEKSDSIIPRWSSFSYIEELLEAGVRVFFFQSGFIHSKYLVVDDVFSSIGTTNLDFRSLETNFEVNAFVYEEAFNADLATLFKNDLKNSYEIKLDEWKQRSWRFKLRESLAHLVSPLL
ncbi:cardiolipin synthetase 2 [Mariniphaga anaerophila]|uniref:Cardiolipin synthase n=1 Tax=Mariniphaga anaerophila TaxID=1484053 RepID=A0A1M5EG10_9BACT|nr:cardiolipin synthase [Mariniphaga anaerophila]SHF78168.1 cardiolipin synthetase 2 [Mariniphaga anaerophila]